jgi:hypothetical protein
VSSLRIYGDEAGTMPVQDSDGPFLVAVVGILGRQLTEEMVSLHRKPMIAALGSDEIIPMVSYVRPVPGFEIAFTAKLSKFNTMARYTRLQSGVNAEYMVKEGFRARNHVWIYCMIHAIGKVVLDALSRSPVTSVEVYLDQKTLPGPTRRFFEDQIREIRKSIDKTIGGLIGKDPNLGKRLALRSVYDKRSISVVWSNDEAASEAVHGLCFAHNLARRVFGDLKSQVGDSSLDTGDRCIENLTQYLMSPIERESIEQWKSSTGLPEPE